MKIAILSRNPKLYSTKRLVEAAIQRGHDAVVVDHTKCNIIIEQSKPSILYRGQSLEDIDAIIPRIGSSVTFFGTAVVRQFEMMKVFSPIESQALVRSRDKLRSLQLLSRAGIDIPKTAFANIPKNDDVKELIKQVGGVPLLIKFLEGAQGVGVVLVESISAAKSVIEAFSRLKENIIVQEFMKESRGKDIRAFVIGNEVIGAIQREGKVGEDFRSNLHRGGIATKVDLNAEEKRIAVESAQCLRLPIAGVDLIQSSRGPLIIEVNSSPGLEGIEKATQIDIAGKIIEFIEKNLKTPSRKIEKTAALSEKE